MNRTAMTRLVCFTCCLLLAGVSGCGKKKEEAGATISRPPIGEKEVGLPFYPGSSEWGTGSTTTQNDERFLASSSRTTDDPPDKVVAYYRDSLKDATVAGENLGDIVRTTIIGTTRDGSEAEVLVMKMPDARTQIFLSVARPAATSAIGSPH